MTDVTIRKARIEDSEFLVPLIDRASEGLSKHLWGQLAEPDQDAWAYGLSRVQGEDTGISYSKAWVAEVHGRAGGCMIAYTKPAVADEIDENTPPLFRPLLELENQACETGYIFVLSTTASMRSQGIGSAMMEFAERFRGRNGMSLIVADNNTRGKALYERLGFREKARRKMVKDGWKTEGENWLLMIKP